MARSNELSDEKIMTNWYRYSAEQPGSVDELLLVLRNRLGQTLEQQRLDFGASETDFNRLRGLRHPRSDQFVSDAQQIAESCHLTNPLVFVRTMILARNLKQQQSTAPTDQSYQAAFDVVDDLDQIPEEE
jgi:hypothetical protein